MSSDNEHAENSDEFALERLKNIRSGNDLRSLQEAMAVYRAPAELDALFSQMDGIVPGADLEDQLPWVDAFNHRRRHKRWMRQIETEIGPAAGSSPWKRVAYTKHLHFYTDDNPDKTGKTLVVGFTGNQHRLMMPTYRLLQNLDAGRFELLMLNDPNRRLFKDGIEGFGKDLDDVCMQVLQFAESRHYGRIVTFGTSGGGLAALYAAVKLGLPKVVMIGTASLSRHPGMAGLLRQVAPVAEDQETKIVSAYSANSNDSDAAQQIKDMFPRTLLEQDSRFTDHNLLMELFRIGELQRFLNSVFDD